LLSGTDVKVAQSDLSNGRIDSRKI
jgi:hypothetical protein